MAFTIQPVSTPEPEPADNALRPPRFPTKTLILVGIGAFLAIGSLTTLIVIRSRNAERQAIRESVTTQVDSAIAQSEQEANSHEFGTAARTLDAADAAVRRSALDVATADSLQRKLTRSRKSLNAAEEDIAAKKRQGWTNFEGRFISGEEKQKIVDGRKRQREQEEDRARAARDEQQRRDAQKEAERLEKARTERWSAFADFVGRYTEPKMSDVLPGYRIVEREAIEATVQLAIGRVCDSENEAKVPFGLGLTWRDFPGFNEVEVTTRLRAEIPTTDERLVLVEFWRRIPNVDPPAVELSSVGHDDLRQNKPQQVRLQDVPPTILMEVCVDFKLPDTLKVYESKPHDLKEKLRRAIVKAVTERLESRLDSSLTGHCSISVRASFTGTFCP